MHFRLQLDAARDDAGVRGDAAAHQQVRLVDFERGATGRPGGQVARIILDSNELHNVPVDPTHGKLTDHNGRTVDFRNVVLIMTSNAGARDMQRKTIGFGSHVDTSKSSGWAFDGAFVAAGGVQDVPAGSWLVKVWQVAQL